jgi:hypothetical protein
MVGELQQLAEARTKPKASNPAHDLVSICKDLNALLTDVDAHNLTAVERRTLKRTSDLISKVLAEIGV